MPTDLPFRAVQRLDFVPRGGRLSDEEPMGRSRQNRPYRFERRGRRALTSSRLWEGA
jgi:hypothetical protein